MEILEVNMYCMVYYGIRIHSTRQSYGRSGVASKFLKGYSKLAKTSDSYNRIFDSQSAIGIAKNIMYNGKSRHIR